MNRVQFLGFVLSVIVAAPAAARQAEPDLLPTTPIRERLLDLAQSYSCSPRRYCSRNLSSCREARWYHQNCSWGGALDGDNDGVPCENLC
jgi:hypothetical protein